MCRSRLYLFSLLFLLLSVASPAMSKVIKIRGGTPTFDIPADAAHVADAAAFLKTANATRKNLNETIDYAASKGKKIKYYKNLSLFDSVDGNFAKTIKEVATSSLVDINNPVSVKNGIYDLFLVIPEDADSGVVQYINAQKRKFYQDTLVEINAAVNDLEKELKKIEEKMQSFRTSLTEGGDGLDSASDNNAAWENTYQANVIYDQILRLTEEITALQNQYNAVSYIYNRLEPLTPYEADRATISFEEDAKDHVSLYYEGSRFFSTSRAIYAQVEASDGLAEETSRPRRFFQTKVAPAPAVDSVFANSEEGFASLNEVNQARDAIYEATEIHNALNSLSRYKEIFIQYERAKALHEKSLQQLQSADQCVINYLGNYYSNPEEVWNGGSLGNLNNHHQLRKGVSKWLIDSFSVAKAELVSSPSTADEMISPVVSLSDVGSIPSLDMSTSNSFETYDNILKEEKIETIDRENNLIGWRVASNISKSLAYDMYHTKRWGTPKKPFPLWNDQKNFYDQYIEGKYDNIAEYLQMMDLREVELKIVQELISKVSDEDAVLHNNWLSLLTDIHSSSSLDEIDNAQSAYKSVLSSQDAHLSSVKQKNVNLLSGVASKLSGLNSALESTEGNIDNYNSSINMHEKSDYASSIGTSIYIPSVIDRNTLAQSSAMEKVKLNSLNAESKDVLLEKKSLEGKASSNVANAERNIVKTLRKASAEKGDVSLTPLVQTFNTEILPTISRDNQDAAKAFVALLTDAKSVVTELKNYGVEEVEKTKLELLSLGDPLYLQESANLVNRRHKELMNDLRSVNVSNVLSFSSVLKSSSSTLVSIAVEVFNSYISEEVCDEDKCYQVDEEYFVSLIPKSRDFMSPKEPINEYLPPLRESVYFDVLNFANLYNENNKVKLDLIPKTSICDKLSLDIFTDKKDYYAYYVSREDILNYGGYLPQVWQLALSGKAFVEKDIDLAKFMGRDALDSDMLQKDILFWKTMSMLDDVTPLDISSLLCGKYGREDYSKFEFYRGGQYPCRIDGKVVDVDNSPSFIVVRSDGAGLPECKGITLSGSGAFYRVEDIEEGARASIGLGKSYPKTHPSEFGMLFDYADDYIILKDNIHDAWVNNERVEQYIAAGRDYTKTVQDLIYENSFLTQNQLGSFLDFVELEEAMRENKESAQTSLDNAKDDLFDILNKIGFVPSEDLNLANDDDFQLVSSSLKSSKSDKLKIAEPIIARLHKTENPVISERIEVARLMGDALKVDNNGLVTVSPTIKSLSAFHESLRSAEANLRATDSYSSAAEEGFQRELNRMQSPYCASY